MTELSLIKLAIKHLGEFVPYYTTTLTVFTLPSTLPFTVYVIIHNKPTEKATFC